MKKRKLQFFAILLAAAMLLTGCELMAPAEPEENLPVSGGLFARTGTVDDDAPKTYTLRWNDTVWVVDQDGNTISEALDSSLTDYYAGWTNPLTDIVTGAVQCYARFQILETPVHGAYGQSIYYETALFDVDGNQITEWSTDFYYGAAFGNFVIRHMQEKTDENYNILIEYKRELINYLTGQVIRDLTDENSQYLAAGGKPVKVVYGEDATELIRLDMEGNNLEILALPVESVIFINEDWILIYQDDAVLACYSHAFEEQPILPWYHYMREVDYYDDEVILVTEYDWSHYNSFLMNRLDGQMLIPTTPSLIVKADLENGEPGFVFVKNHEIFVCDKSGTVIANSAYINNLDEAYVLDNGLICYSIEKKYEEENQSYSEYYFGMMDTEFNILIPATGGAVQYYHMSTPFVDGYATDEIICFRHREHFRDALDFGWDSAGHFIDIYTSDGTLIVDYIRELYAAGPNRLAVQRGQWVGLMDWEGNWIVKRSIYNELMD